MASSNIAYAQSNPTNDAAGHDGLFDQIGRVDSALPDHFIDLVSARNFDERISSDVWGVVARMSSRT